MSMPTLRAGFIGAAKGALRLDTAALHYVDGKQQLRLTGWHNTGPAFGVPFAIVSKPFNGDPVMRAAQLAQDLVALHTGKPMSLLGKMTALTERAQDFTKATEASMDEIAAKIGAAERKRDEAMPKHHAYYDSVITGIDESVKVIDRLSNGPLDGSSGG